MVNCNLVMRLLDTKIGLWLNQKRNEHLQAWIQCLMGWIQCLMGFGSFLWEEGVFYLHGGWLHNASNCCCLEDSIA